MRITKHVKRRIRKFGNVRSHMRYGAPDFFRHAYTVEHRVCLDENGSPIPWLTYPCVCYLKQLDFSQRCVFEYGSGASTEFWASRAKRVVALESDAAWAARITNLALPNVELIVATDDTYVAACNRDAPHDVIVIDGYWRYDCAQVCVEALSPGGMIILDNSERYPAITEYLRGQGLIQVDFVGTGPINRYVWATSIFLTRDVDMQPIKAIQPHYVRGMTDSIEKKPELITVNRAGSY